jgi:hypothetical protein
MTRGIYVVAFGDPSRTCALALMRSIKTYLAEIPVCLCSDRRIGPEDVLVLREDGEGSGNDIGGRKAKLSAYDVTPAEWDAVLYLDADTEIVPPADVRRFFDWIEDGWEFVICKDPHLMDTLQAYARRNNYAEMALLQKTFGTLNALMYNGGVWAFARSERVKRFFARWQRNWEKHAQRDQGPLLSAMHEDPLRVLLLGNEWNTFPKYSRGVTTAGLMHYPGRARRWKGLINGRIDGERAWAAVDRYMKVWRRR